LDIKVEILLGAKYLLRFPIKWSFKVDLNDPLSKFSTLMTQHFRMLMTEAVSLDLSDLIKFYGKGRVIEADQDDLRELSTVSQVPLNFGLITNFRKREDLTADQVSISTTFYKQLFFILKCFA